VVPLHLYFMLASFAVGVFLLWYRRRKRFDGELLLWFMLLHEGAKAALETFRVPFIPALQWISTGVAIAAALALVTCHTIDRRSRVALKMEGATG
jgi:phosphatidylglycerol---prolipoprotein diacylglyceryl transferase